MYCLVLKSNRNKKVIFQSMECFVNPVIFLSQIKTLNTLIWYTGFIFYLWVNVIQNVWSQGYVYTVKSKKVDYGADNVFLKINFEVVF